MKYKTLIVFLIVLICWSFLFSGIKFFIWQDLQYSIKPSLETLAGYLSLGSAFAYLIGGAISLVFLKRYLLFAFSISVALLLILTYFFPISSNIYLILVISIIGFLYGLWVVLRTIILSIEIQKTGINEAKLNAIANILFIIFLILGSILGSRFYETIGHKGIWILIGILFFTAFLSMLLDYEEVTVKLWIKSIFSKKYILEKKESFSKALSEFIPQVKYISLHWKGIILTSSILWAITTIVSQKAIEYSIEHFHISASKAAFILIYSSIGAIFGNIISTFLVKKRWLFFLISSIFMSGSILTLLNLNTFFQVSIIAFLVGLLFGISSNLIDSYFLLEIGKEDKKEYGSAAYGFILSLVIFLLMLFSTWLESMFGFNILIIFLSLFLFIVSTLFFIRRSNN